MLSVLAPPSRSAVFISVSTEAASHDENQDAFTVQLEQGERVVAKRLVLATGKNFAHRIYIGKCIYADLTLIYQKNGYQPLPWTYPDYAHDDIRNFLLLVRNKYTKDLEDLKEGLR